MIDERIEKLTRAWKLAEAVNTGMYSANEDDERVAARYLAAVDADPEAYGYMLRIPAPSVPTVPGQYGPVEVPG